MAPTSNEIEEQAYGKTDRAALRIGLIYMLTAFVIFLAMGLLGMMMRLDQSGWLHLSADWFYRIMTIHGAGMVGAMLLATMGGMVAALSRTVVLSVRWLWTAYFIYSLSIVFLLIAVLAGRFAGAWTALDPLPYLGRTWGIWAGVMMYVALLCIGVGFTIYCLHLLLTLRHAYGGVGRALAWRYLFSRGPADPNLRVPNPTELAAMAVSIIGMVTGVVGVAVLIPLFIEATGIVDLNKLYTKNTEMFFGHAIANLSLYLAIGLVYALLPIYTKRRGNTSKLIVLAWNLTIVLVIAPSSHHLYQDFSQPIAYEIIGQIASWGVIPEVLLVTIIDSLAHIYRSGMRWAVPSVLMVIGFWGWVFGGMGAVFDASIPANNLTHNTLWVPAHFHTYYLLGVVVFVWAYLFYLIGDLSGTHEWAGSKIAAWLFGLGGIGFILLFFIGGADSIPRRYANWLPGWHIYAQVAVPFVGLIIVSLLWLIADVARGARQAWQVVNLPEIQELP